MKLFFSFVLFFNGRPSGLAPQTTLEGLTSAVKTNFVGVKKVTLYLKSNASASASASLYANAFYQ